MLDIKNIRKTFNPGTVNEKTALNGVSLTLEDGDFVTVIGGNGAGKSTLLNAVAGVWPVDSGSISIGGTDVTRLPEHKRAKYIGRVFQDPMMGTAATMQIEENMALAARRGRARTLRPGITRDERERYRETLKILDLGLEDRLTTLMITHNMKDAIVHGNRLIMMYEGRVALDISGEDKKRLTVEDLLARFGQATGSDEADDKLLLG